MSAPESRDYQLTAVEASIELLKNKVRRFIFCAPCGSGKTHIAALVMLRAIAKGKRCVFVVHRKELLDQCVMKLLSLGVDPQVIGVISAGKPSKAMVDKLGGDPRKRRAALVQVAMVRSLYARANIESPNIVIVDECHHVRAESYKILRKNWPDAVHIGLTATPERLDGLGLGTEYDDIIQVAKVSDLIGTGYLVAPRVFVTKGGGEIDLSSVKIDKKSGDYATGELSAVMNTPRQMQDVFEHWETMAEGRRTIAFAVDVAHSKALVASFLERGVPAEHVDGTTPALERDAIFARLAAGETLLVSNVDIATEGWDCPAVKVLLSLRPTKSRVMWLQRAGRVMRPFEDQPALVIDAAGCAMEHGLPQDDIEWTLEAGGSGGGKKRKGGRKCLECRAVSSYDKTECVNCGFVFPVRAVEIVEANTFLEEITEETKVPTYEVRLKIWNRLLHEWRHAVTAAMATASGVPPKAGMVWTRYREEIYGKDYKEKVLTPKKAERAEHNYAQLLRRTRLNKEIRDVEAQVLHGFVMSGEKDGMEGALASDWEYLHQLRQQKEEALGADVLAGREW